MGRLGRLGDLGEETFLPHTYRLHFGEEFIRLVVDVNIDGRRDERRAQRRVAFAVGAIAQDGALRDGGLEQLVWQHRLHARRVVLVAPSAEQRAQPDHALEVAPLRFVSGRQPMGELYLGRHGKRRLLRRRGR